MASMEAIEGKVEMIRKAFPNSSPLDKIIVAFAGPLFSFGLALIAFAVIVWQVGRLFNQEGGTTKHRLGGSRWSRRAWLACGAGDVITAVDGHPVKSFMPTASLSDSIKWRIITSTGPHTIQIDYQRRDNANPPAYEHASPSMSPPPTFPPDGT